MLCRQLTINIVGLPLPLDRVLKQAEETCGEIKQHNYREKQSFVFIQFSDSQVAHNCLNKGFIEATFRPFSELLKD
jgi:hypothetical protein